MSVMSSEYTIKDSFTFTEELQSFDLKLAILRKTWISQLDLYLITSD